ncbi:hypothetical protein F8A87_08155 [Betaproteobacteria bacterium SCN2]|jgi:hypothetical protein|nr:hypothetical protein F8A87_08155 [Betaproteobacteria bacterium SCN2]
MIDALRKVSRYALKAIGVLLLLWFFLGIASMGYSHTYYQQAQAYFEGAQNVLIAHGLCQNKNDCNKKEFLFWTAGGIKIGQFDYGGPTIYVYEVSSPDVVGDLVKAFGEIYKKQKGPKLTVLVYETKHRESKTQFASVKIE